ncbi:AMP-binding protein [Flammeovirgaceae bacterium SG7u.111]|nr:AMP-binding protein [Flammeovirgaceae bacterium SG7u.132]WPO33786.1 AMP-binding protein [Flammeovirgaceae bacterium SG7u.111]
MKEHKWFEKYPEGTKHEIDPDIYPSMLEMLEESMKKYEGLIAYEGMDKSLKFEDIDRLTKDFAAFLQSLGLKPGDRIAIQMPNVLQYPIALLGSIRAGLVVVGTNPLYTAREMEHQFKDSGAKALVVLANFASSAQKVLPQTDIEHVIVTEIGDMLGGIKKPLVNFVVKYIKKMVPSYSLPKAIKFNTALAKGASMTYKRPTITGDDLMFLQYTGGTTGVSKGAMLTHRNILANMLQILEWMKPKLIERKEVVVTPLPLYHIFALTVNCLAMLRIGAKNVLIVNPRDMEAFIKDMEKYPFSVLTGVNTLFNAMLNNERFRNLDFSSLKIAVGGGMAVQNAVARKWEEVTGTPLVEGYGLSETSPLLSCNPIDGTEKIGTIGLPAPSTEIIVADENGEQLEQGQVGEICAKGPQVMKGYWKRDDETRKVFVNGWFRTGDIGMMEEDGFFKIVDRKKDMILVSGFNVYPNEVEDEISKHKGVMEVAAIGVPDERSTEAVKVFIVKKDESLTAEDIRTYCKTCLTGYKVPKYVEFMDELPKSNVGKILRRVLKEKENSKQTTNA